MKTACIALALVAALSHPIALECGDDTTSRLKVGATIMGQPVVAGPEKGGGAEIMSITKSLVTFKAFNPNYFAVKAFGEGATLYCHEGYNNVTNDIANCTSQAVLLSDMTKGKVPGVIAPQFFTCNHKHATSITIGYSAAGPPVAIVSRDVPK